MSANKNPAQRKLAEPRPSSSVVLISPSNQVLLLHRVQTSTSFPSAHVFPGGNIDEQQDGTVPRPDESGRHTDGQAYRLAAVRETFEESGILLAKRRGDQSLLNLDAQEREDARTAIHSGERLFTKWLVEKDAIPDLDALIPFTRWITPTNVPKRFTTQMYIYFLPLSSTTQRVHEIDQDAIDIFNPRPDGGKEHTAARFLAASEWISRARANKIILFPPQFYILKLVAQFLDADSPASSIDDLAARRQKLLDFATDPATDPSWAERCMSPEGVGFAPDGRAILRLLKPGPELKDSGRRGDPDNVVLVNFKKGGPRDVEVRNFKEVMDWTREHGLEKKSSL